MVFYYSNPDRLRQAVMAAFSLGVPWSVYTRAHSMLGTAFQRIYNFPYGMALWQNLKSLHCNPSLGACQKLYMVSFPSADTSNTIGSSGSYSLRWHLLHHSLDMLQSPFHLWTESKPAAFHVSWYVVWSSPDHMYVDGAFRTQGGLPRIILPSLRWKVQDAIICPMLWLPWHAPDHCSS